MSNEKKLVVDSKSTMERGSDEAAHLSASHIALGVTETMRHWGSVTTFSLLRRYPL
jgi:hypothetical protein